MTTHASSGPPADTKPVAFDPSRLEQFRHLAAGEADRQLNTASTRQEGGHQ